MRSLVLFTHGSVINKVTHLNILNSDMNFDGTFRFFFYCEESSGQAMFFIAIILERRDEWRKSVCVCVCVSHDFTVAQHCRNKKLLQNIY